MGNAKRATVQPPKSSEMIDEAQSGQQPIRGKQKILETLVDFEQKSLALGKI